jgi:NADP-dependent alcohol dehydrogenase
MIGHELTALHGIDHARTLAIIVPSLLDVQRGTKGAKLMQYGERVWGITEGLETARVDAAIERTRGFYESLGLRTRLRDYEVDVATAAEVAGRLRARGLVKIGERADVTPEVVERILCQAA